MPRNTRVRAGQADGRRPPTAAELEKRLFGLGQFTLQLDGWRLTVPAPVRSLLGPLAQQPFVFSLWDGPRLRIIPQTFWTLYLDSLRTRLPDPLAAQDLVSRLCQGCIVRSLDAHHHRWDLPATLARHVGLGSAHNSVVLLPHRFWLELLPTEAWRTFMTQTLECAHEATLRSADFEI